MVPQVGTEQYGICSVSPADQVGLPGTLTTVSQDDVPSAQVVSPRGS
jgi:hypothetical protein